MPVSQDGFDLGWKLAWELRGWAGLGLLETYEGERRPIALHNIGYAAETGGARRTTDAALPWDLDDRLNHVWVERNGVSLSTLEWGVLVRPDGHEIARWRTPDALPEHGPAWLQRRED